MEKEGEDEENQEEKLGFWDVVRHNSVYVKEKPTELERLTTQIAKDSQTQLGDIKFEVVQRASLPACTFEPIPRVELLWIASSKGFQVWKIKTKFPLNTDKVSQDPCSAKFFHEPKGRKRLKQMMCSKV